MNEPAVRGFKTGFSEKCSKIGSVNTTPTLDAGDSNIPCHPAHGGDGQAWAKRDSLTSLKISPETNLRRATKFDVRCTTMPVGLTD